MFSKNAGLFVLGFACVYAVLSPGGACGSGRPESRTTGRMEGVTPGIWGGNDIRMEVTENGARLEYACAHGAISHKIETDASGRFEAKGTHTRESGGPERENDESGGDSASYSGHTDGKKMTLTVTLTGTGENIGTFTLYHGKQIRLVKCL